MIKEISKYIPTNSIDLVGEILVKNPISIKVVNQRATKHGDFKVLRNGKTQITINNNLNKYQFLLTLIHEIAHFETFRKSRRVKPHGIEWKRNFQYLMLPFLQPTIFPNSLLPYLANYLKNPKASTGSDVNLSRALLYYSETSTNNYIFELEVGTLFNYKNKTYKLGKKRRTRFECLEIKSKKLYLFNQNAEIEIIKNKM
ncbi:sprT domain-containing protein [Lutibacter sp. TH_r2]|uniref:SprT-like domain-containing protein n=1 Tax=Lutibacter sp. TH_r2 TaxID=3082083 RepID=UPI00295347F7|nr:SprT-like domain-containing protein [Lutibacter sp. TH_r2]MDV7188582.1 sprT domain-containing protein [Lutibacter sp. TH_r2]